MIYIEDYLHTLIDSFEVDAGDKPILSSISTQCKKGIALTDRQYALVKSKLSNYASVFATQGIEFNDQAPPRQPLREIDRRKFINIVSHAEMIGPNQLSENRKQNWQWIQVRFPFSKKDIVKVEKVLHTISAIGFGRKNQYHHVRGSHEHYFFLNSVNAFHVYNELKNRNFEICDKVTEIAKKAEDIFENKNNYIPHCKDNGIVNLSESIVDLVIDDIGNFDSESAVKYKDRSVRYGYSFETYPNSGSLLDRVACRDSHEIIADPQNHTLNTVVELMHRLDRFPIVVLIDPAECFDQTVEIHKAFKYIVSENEQSVLFRADSDDTKNRDINDYIRENNLNNWVDNNTKIVYISKNKLPKALLTSDFKPITALGKTSMRSTTHVDNYIKFNCDLIMYHDSQKSLFGKYSNTNVIL